MVTPRLLKNKTWILVALTLSVLLVISNFSFVVDKITKNPFKLEYVIDDSTIEPDYVMSDKKPYSDVPDDLSPVTEQTEFETESKSTFIFESIVTKKIPLAEINEPAVEDIQQNNKQRKNVLFLMTDDMRPQLGAYEGIDFPNPLHQIEMHTPNIDQLASRSLLLRRAYVQYSLCGPSRASMLTSRRPDTTRVFYNYQYWRVHGGNYTTLPEYFKQNGYTTLGIGKIFHQGEEASNNQDPISWSKEFYHSEFTDPQYYNDPVGAGYKAVPTDHHLPLTDEDSIRHAKEVLKDLAIKATRDDQPFFMALGFHKPHLNFLCPKQFFDLYELETDKQYMSNISWQTPPVKEYVNIANTTKINGKLHISDLGMRHLRQAYFACISYIDSLVGVLVAELDKLGLTNSTIVSFVADHGYHLGEQYHIEKSTNHESATHVPMIIHVPGLTDEGIETRSLVEAVDLFPTIVEAAGLGTIPQCPANSFNTSLCTEGTSLMPLIKYPEESTKKFIFTQVKGLMNHMQYSIRNHRYRFSAWAKIRRQKLPHGRHNYHITWDSPGENQELYDLNNDPEEQTNLATSSKHRSTKNKMEKRLQHFFTSKYEVPGTKSAIL